MGRRRNKQNQTSRIYYRDKDHREVIMDDSYHGAMYLAEQYEPVWRRYKPRLVFGVVKSIDNITFTGHLVTVDVENKYFSMLHYFPRYEVFGESYYRLRTPLLSHESPFILNNDMIWTIFIDISDRDRSGGGFGLISKNGYDWKTLEYYPLPPGVTNYGGYQKFANGLYIFADRYPEKLYDVYDLKYQDGEQIATIEGLGTIPYDNTLGGYSIGGINTSQYSGYVTYKTTTTSVVRNRITYFTYKYDLNVYDYSTSSFINIYHKDGPANVPSSDQAYYDKVTGDVKAVYYTNDYFFFIQHWYVRSRTTGLGTERLICCYAPISNININSWSENTITTNIYNPTTSSPDYMRYDYNCYFVTFRNNKAYFYIMYYIGTGDSMIAEWHLFISSDLQNWERVVLPDYLDVPYFNEDNSDNRYGVIVNSQYDYVRVPLCSTALSGVPSNTLLAVDNMADMLNVFGFNMGQGIFTGGSSKHSPMTDNVWFEIIDGKPTTDIMTEDLWIFDVCPNTIIYIDNMTFSQSSNNCAYAIYTPTTIPDPSPYSGYDIVPYKEPIDESDYIFD